MAVRVLEHEPACVWAYGALKLADVWKKEGGGGEGWWWWWWDAGVERAEECRRRGAVQ